MSSIFGQIRQLALELLAFECQKQKFPPVTLCNLYPIFMKLADNTTGLKIFDKLETGPQCTLYFGVTCPLVAGTSDRCLLGNLFTFFAALDLNSE